MPGDWPLLDDFAIAEMRAQADANLPHSALVESTDDDGVTWSNVAPYAGAGACRLMRPSTSDVRADGADAMRAATQWVVAFTAGSPHTAPRLRLTISGDDAGTAFTRVLYTIGALTPLANTADARVLCSEDPLAIVGT